MSELKPCPFCGSADVQISPYDGGKTVVCIHCLCQTATYRDDDALKNAKAAWNSRAQPDNEPLTLEELRGMDGEPVWVEKLDNSQLSGWHLIRGNGNDAVLIAKDGWKIPADCLGNYRLAYRRKPEPEGGAE